MYKKGVIIALTGASGIIYGIRLLQQTSLLKKSYREVYAVYSRNAARVAEIEESTNLVEFLKSLELSGFYSSDDLEAPIASSSRLVGFDMVVIPASLNTIAKIAHGIQDNLITRSASGILRLRGKLVVVVRDTPLSAIDLENLLKLARAGALILPASPALYPKPKSLDDIINFVVGKVLDVLDIEHNLYIKWKPGT